MTTPMPEPAPPAVAEDLALLREALSTGGRMPQRDSRLLAALDRLAAAIPREQAKDRYGDLLWQHSCGEPEAGEAGLPPLYCAGSNCYSIDETWLPLYTLQGGE